MLKTDKFNYALWRRCIYANKNLPRFIYLNKPKCGCQSIRRTMTKTEILYHNKNMCLSKEWLKMIKN
jgi:hypothetical protein